MNQREIARRPHAVRPGTRVPIGPVVAVILLALVGCSAETPSPRPVSQTATTDGGDSQALPQTMDGRHVDPLEPRPDGWTVLVFVRSDCPIANRYAPKLNRLAQGFTPRNVRFLRVYPDPAETPEVIRQHTQEFQHQTEALWDPDHWLVDRMNAQVTPEAVLVDHQGQVLYQGRIDNRFVDFGETRNRATREDLKLALQAAVDGEPVEVARTEAVGCLIADVK